MKKLIPPYLLVICLIVMIKLHYLCPGMLLVYVPFNFAGIFLIAFGILLIGQVRIIISRVKTEIHTFKKPIFLIKEGPFKYSRNPIYLGFTLILLGSNIILGSLTPAFSVIAFIIITEMWYIPYEEKFLEKQFGKEYSDYKKSVRRWV